MNSFYDVSRLNKACDDAAFKKNPVCFYTVTHSRVRSDTVNLLGHVLF